MRSVFDDGFRPELVEGAEFDGLYDMPVIRGVPDTVPLPAALLPFEKRRRFPDPNQTIHYYMADYRFRQIITSTERYVDDLRQFEGVISPDCSLYYNMPLAPQIANTYLSRAVGHYLQREGLLVWPNVRWSTERSFSFCFDGLPAESTLAISTHGCMKSRKNKYYFQLGLEEMMSRLRPKRIIVHGHMPEDVFGPYRSYVEFAHFLSRITVVREGGE